MSPRIHVVANPAAGQDEPVLAVLNRVFQRHGVDWEIAVTQEEGDAGRLATEAVEAGADVVAAYGGDGTVSAVATRLAGTDRALAILPGGTGNAAAQELGVPGDLERAAELACGAGGEARPVDVLRARDRCFLLRLGVGADARMVKGASREWKDRLGWLAYLASGLGQLVEPEVATYRVELDGRELRLDGIGCIVANIGRIGRGGLSLDRSIDAFDGRLDVLVLPSADLRTIAALGGKVAGVLDGPDVSDGGPDAALHHLQGTSVRVAAEPRQPVHGDGELLEDTPLEVTVEPGGLRVVLPVEPPR